MPAGANASAGRPATSGAGSGGAGRSPAGRFAAPFMVLFAVFMAVPVVASLVMSVTDLRSTDLRNPLAVNFVGVDNFTRLFSDELFLQVAGQHARLRRRRRAADDGARAGRGERAQLGPDQAARRCSGSASTCRWSPASWRSPWSGGSCSTRSPAWSTRCSGCVGIDGPDWLGNTVDRAALADRHGGVAQLRLPHGDLPGRAAGDPGRAVRGGHARRRRAVGPVPARHAAAAAPDAAVRRAWSPASATCSSSRSRS